MSPANQHTRQANGVFLIVRSFLLLPGRESEGRVSHHRSPEVAPNGFRTTSRGKEIMPMLPPTNIPEIYTMSTSPKRQRRVDVYSRHPTMCFTSAKAAAESTKFTSALEDQTGRTFDIKSDRQNLRKESYRELTSYYILLIYCIM